MTAWLRYWSIAYTRHLEAEILWYREQLDREKSRANQAVDALLLTRTGVPGVTPPPPITSDDYERHRRLNEAMAAMDQVGEVP